MVRGTLAGAEGYLGKPLDLPALDRLLGRQGLYRDLGAAGTSGSTGDSGIEKCDKPMGAMAVVEPQDFVVQSLSQYGLQSPVPLIRMMIQQSNCFIVVERGVGMQNAMQERELAASGEARAGSNMGKGQMVAADFILTPEVVFSENNAGGVGGALGGVQCLPADLPITQTDLAIRPVRIAEWVDIGVNAVVLPGVTIGQGAQIGAGAVVTRDVHENEVVVGNPSRVINNITKIADYQ